MLNWLAGGESLIRKQKVGKIVLCIKSCLCVCLFKGVYPCRPFLQKLCNIFRVQNDRELFQIEYYLQA